jgi:hypothetical protein
MAGSSTEIATFGEKLSVSVPETEKGNAAGKAIATVSCCPGRWGFALIRHSRKY